MRINFKYETFKMELFKIFKGKKKKKEHEVF